MSRRADRASRPLPHAKYGVDLGKVPDTYIEPFVAYRAWKWTAEGVTSLNGALWTPKVAFEATCHYAGDLRSIRAAAIGSVAAEFWESKSHQVPDPGCTCGMYAGIGVDPKRQETHAFRRCSQEHRKCTEGTVSESQGS